MPDQSSWWQRFQAAIEKEVFLIFLFNSNMLVKGEGGDYLYEDKNRDDGDQVSDHEGDDASDKSQSESEEKDKDEIGKDKHDEERFYSKTFLELATKSALKKSDVGLTKDNDDGKYAAELDASGLLSLEEHLLLMEGRLIEDISNIVREELAEFKRLFVSWACAL